MELKMSFEDGKKFDEKQQDKIDSFQDEIWALEKQIKMIQEAMSNAIYEAVKKANVTV